jgi:hypothetical protein
MTATAICHCTRCRVAAAGLGPGPYTPAEYALIAPATVLSVHDDPVSDDPAVKAAQLEVKLAREAFEPYDQAWLEAIAASRQAEQAERAERPYQRRGGMFTLGRGRRMAELAERVKQAREARDTAWQAVIRANTALQRAQGAALLQVVQAERGRT